MVQFAYLPSPKPEHKRKQGKRANRAAFSAATRLTIIERDNGLCVRCQRPYQQIHHITFRSAGGMGHHSNGVCVCVSCHQWAHSGREGREWFEQYRLLNLLEELK